MPVMSKDPYCHVLPVPPVRNLHQLHLAPIINPVPNAHQVHGDVIGVHLMRHVMPWDPCMDVPPGQIVMPFIDVNDWNRNRWRGRGGHFRENRLRV